MNDFASCVTGKLTLKEIPLARSNFSACLMLGVSAVIGPIES
jgi:hypothetical protein